MAHAKRPTVEVSYNDRDITADLSETLIAFAYTDKVAGETDEVSIDVSDTKGLWQNSWYPDKGAKLKISFGWPGAMTNAGTFQVCEIEVGGPPSVATLRAHAAGVSKAVRSPRSEAHEDKTLRQIAQAVADRHGFTIAGEIDDVRVGRTTQVGETDLAFLARIADDYGHAFSLRDSVITFTNFYKLESAETAATVDLNDCESFRVKDVLIGTFKKATVRARKSTSKAALSAAADLGMLPGDGGADESADTLEIRVKAEDELQAEHKAKRKLHKANRRLGVTVEITTAGNPYLVAGNSVELTGFGRSSGAFFIHESRHDITKDGAYKTSFTAGRTRKVPESKHAPRGGYGGGYGGGGYDAQPVAANRPPANIQFEKIAVTQALDRALMFYDAGRLTPVVINETLSQIGNAVRKMRTKEREDAAGYIETQIGELSAALTLPEKMDIARDLRAQVPAL